MTDTEIVRPATVLALFTLIVVLLMGLKRLRSQLINQTTEGDYKYGESAAVPVEIGIFNRNYMNLLELPVLFYLASIIVLIIDGTDKTFLNLAWSYAALRIVHSTIHLTYNRVLHRSIVFAASNGVLAIMWIRIMLAVW